MAKRVANKRVLEWVSERVTATGQAGPAAETVRAVIALNLDDDEVAEIRMIETEIDIQQSELIDDNSMDAQLLLSMDPSVSTAAAPYDEVQYEDLETFHNHRTDLVTNFTTSGATAIDTNSRKVVEFPDDYPLLLATNPALLVVSPAIQNLSADFFARIWFTRRKSVGNELARTLLKRR